jgi:hypothetical protein
VGVAVSIASVSEWNSLRVAFEVVAVAFEALAIIQGFAAISLKRGSAWVRPGALRRLTIGAQDNILPHMAAWLSSSLD